MADREPQYAMQHQLSEGPLMYTCALCGDGIDPTEEEGQVIFRPSDDAPEAEWTHLHGDCVENIEHLERR